MCGELTFWIYCCTCSYIYWNLCGAFFFFQYNAATSLYTCCLRCSIESLCAFYSSAGKDLKCLLCDSSLNAYTRECAYGKYIFAINNWARFAAKLTHTHSVKHKNELDLNWNLAAPRRCRAQSFWYFKGGFSCADLIIIILVCVWRYVIL